MCPADTVTALTALYLATDGPNWSDNANWMDFSLNPCNALSYWSGIEGSGTGVIRLNIQAQGLVGTLPTELGLLTDLTRFSVADEPLVDGTIPSQLGLLIGLENFKIETVAVTGAIPSQLGLLPLLDTFKLKETMLMGRLPSQLGNLCPSAKIEV